MAARMGSVACHRRGHPACPAGVNQGARAGAGPPSRPPLAAPGALRRSTCLSIVTCCEPGVPPAPHPCARLCRVVPGPPAFAPGSLRPCTPEASLGWGSAGPARTRLPLLTHGWAPAGRSEREPPEEGGRLLGDGVTTRRARPRGSAGPADPQLPRCVITLNGKTKPKRWSAPARGPVSEANRGGVRTGKTRVSWPRRESQAPPPAPVPSTNVSNAINK